MVVQVKPRCRVCLSDDKGESKLNSLKEEEVRKLYEECISSPLDSDVIENDTGHLCSSCIYRLMLWSNFKTLAIEADRQLKLMPNLKMSDYCRICLNICPLMRTHLMTNERTRKVYLDATSIQVDKDDESHLCVECYNKCAWWNVFCEQAVKVNNFMSDDSEVKVEPTLEIKYEDVDGVIPEILQCGWVNHQIDIVKDERLGSTATR